MPAMRALFSPGRPTMDVQCRCRHTHLVLRPREKLLDHLVHDPPLRLRQRVQALRDLDVVAQAVNLHVM